MQTCDQIIDEFNKYITHYQKFTMNGQKASARRARKALANLIPLSRKARREILSDITFRPNEHL